MFISFLCFLFYRRTCLFCFPAPDFLEEEEGVDPEDEVEMVGTPASRASQASTRHPRRAGGATPGERREEKEEEGTEVDQERQQEQEEEANNNVVRRRPGKRVLPYERQRDADLEREWRHHRDKGRHAVVKPPPEEPKAGGEEEEEEEQGVVPGGDGGGGGGRHLSWIRTGPEELSRKGPRAREPAAAPKLSKSALLFPQKASLNALTSRAKQILTNSAHAPRGPADTHSHTHTRAKEHKRDPNKIYITRPRPAKDKKAPQSRQPREVFPGVFLYQTGKTTRLVNLGAKARGSPLLPKPPPKSVPVNGNHTRPAAAALHRQSSRAAVLSHTDLRRAATQNPPLPPKAPHTTTTAPKSHHHHQQQQPSSPTGLAPNLSENTGPMEARVTSYMRTSEITESQQQHQQHQQEQEQEPEQEQEQEPEPGPEQDQEPEQGQGTVPEEEGGLSEYSYEEAEPRPGWAEEAINWQRTFSVNTMDFELLRSDWNDLRCNVSGNLQLAESEVVDVLAQYMEKLNERNGG